MNPKKELLWGLLGSLLYVASGSRVSNCSVSGLVLSV